MNLTMIAFGTVFVMFGVLFSAGRIHTHIAAWRNMSDEERESVDIVPLCRNIGGMIVISGAVFLFCGLVPVCGTTVFRISITAWIVLAGLDFYWIGKSKRYQRGAEVDNKSASDGSAVRGYRRNQR